MSEKIIHKAGLQSEEDPFEFIMSTEDVDRMGDIVVQDWKLKHFRKNPIALAFHDSERPIGVWERVRVTEGHLRGRLKLAAEGTSKFVDWIRSMIQQRILKAVSVGFRPSDYEPLDPNDPYSGYKLMGNELLECSVVSVPANPMAISVAKSLDPEFRGFLLPKEPDPGFTSFVSQYDEPIPSAKSTVIRSATTRADTTFVTRHNTKRISLDEMIR